MLAKAGKFKFNAETALHSPSLCVGAGGGKESLQNQPAMVSSSRQPRGGKLGAHFTWEPCFWRLY